MDIRILPSNIANMIAAGEVVQRPASVVKELMENSVDAGADQITVAVSDAGRTLIQVIDNGSGMSPDDAVLCFERHATSKLASVEDLFDITSFGFRGEALASIAAVAEVTLKTRRAEDEVGCIVEFADSRHISTNLAAMPVGSNFSVRNLFYNIPARRKHLKSDNVELKHIVSEFTRVALTRPEAGFTLTHNGREIYVLKPAKSMKFRIQDLLGSNVVNEVVDLSAETSVVKVNGYVGRPDTAKKSLGNQYFFVNGRFFKSPYLHKAVMKAYENMIPEGTTPSYFIFLEVDPHTIDVNIHPTKTEIKFEDENVIFQILFASIKETLGKNSFVESIDFNREGAPEIPVFTKNFEEYRPVSEPSIGLDPGFNPFDNDGFPSEESPFTNNIGMTEKYASAPYKYVDKREDYGKLFEDKTLPSRQVLVIQGKYILTSVRSGLLLINIKRAKERILFERFLQALSKNTHVTQTTLFPVSVRVGVENVLLFSEHASLLESLGFDIAVFGNDSITVNGVPEGYSAEPGKIQTIVSDLILALSDNHGAIHDTMMAKMAERFARIGALDNDPMSSPAEAQRLIDALFACENAEYTSSGHKTMNIIPAEDLEKFLH